MALHLHVVRGRCSRSAPWHSRETAHSRFRIAVEHVRSHMSTCKGGLPSADVRDGPRDYEAGVHDEGVLYAVLYGGRVLMYARNLLLRRA